MLSSSSLSFIFVAALAAAPAAVAQQDLFAPSFDVVAYQLAAAADATTYLVACTAGSDSKTCSFSQPYTLVQGPSTARFTMSVPGQGVATVGCDLSGKTSMACVATGDAANVATSTVTATTTVTGVAAETHFRAITMVTAAGDLFTYPTPTTTSHTSSTTHTTTTYNTTTTTPTYYASTSGNTTTTAPTTTSVPLGTAPVNTTAAATTPAGSSGSSATASTIPNAGMLSASSNIGGVIGAAIAVGVFFLAGVL